MAEMKNKGSSAALVKKAAEGAAIAITPESVVKYINALATGQEIALFLNQCSMFGLNPFKREIYLIKYSAKDPATFVVGYDVYLKRAERTGKWAGMESGTVDRADGSVEKAWAKIFRKDWTMPLYHEVFFSEYVQSKDEWQGGSRTGRKVPTRFWAEKPRTMLKKVAIAQALRMAFPDEFGGMPYAAEEMPIEHSRLPSAEVQPQASEYEAMKRKPLPNPKDEFSFEPEKPQATGGERPSDASGEEQPGEFADGDEDQSPIPDACSSEQLATLKAAITKLRELGPTDEKIYIGINRQLVAKKLMVIAELRDLTTTGAALALEYINRWRHGIIEERKKEQIDV